MKLIIAIVQDEDSSKLVSKLMQNGFSVTKLATTGGVDESRIDEAVHTIESVCKSRKQLTTATTMIGGAVSGDYSSYPVEVTIGGATLFILTVDQFLKV